MELAVGILIALALGGLAQAYWTEASGVSRRDVSALSRPHLERDLRAETLWLYSRLGW
jgi:ABC-type Fe2+-enterobactin transport system substrate-binding protein